MILYITELFGVGKKKFRLLAWWHKNVLIVKNWDNPKYSGAVLFLKDFGLSDGCPVIDWVEVESSGVGCVIQGEDSSGVPFRIVSATADFSKNMGLTFHRASILERI